MNIVKCENGHYYDESKYELCPHCLNGIKKIRKDSIPNDVEMVIKGGFAEFVSASQITSSQTVAKDENNARRIEIEQHYGQAREAIAKPFVSPDSEMTETIELPEQQLNDITSEEETAVLFDFGGQQ